MNLWGRSIRVGMSDETESSKDFGRTVHASKSRGRRKGTLANRVSPFPQFPGNALIFSSTQQLVVRDEDPLARDVSQFPRRAPAKFRRDHFGWTTRQPGEPFGYPPHQGLMKLETKRDMPGGNALARNIFPFLLHRIHAGATQIKRNL